MKTIHPPRRVAIAIFALFTILSPTLAQADNSNSPTQAYQQIEEYMDRIRYYQGLQFLPGNQLTDAAIQQELDSLSNEFTQFSLTLTSGYDLNDSDLKKVRELSNQCLEALEALEG